MFALSVCLLTAIGFAFAIDPTDPIGMIVAAFYDFKSHQVLLGAGVIVMLFVGLSKQGWLSAKLQSLLPASLLPWYTLAISMLATWSTEVTQGTSWSQAILDALKLAMAAIFTHQLVIESMRGGKELIPERKPKLPPASSGSSSNTPTFPPKTPPPPVAARIGIGHYSVTWPWRTALLGIVVLCAGCSSPLWKSVVNTVLTDVENGSALTAIESAVAAFFPSLAGDAAAIASIVQAAINFLVSTGDIPQPVAQPYLEKLKVQLDAAKQAGWKPSAEVARAVAGIGRGDRRSVAVLEAVRGGVR